MARTSTQQFTKVPLLFSAAEPDYTIFAKTDLPKQLGNNGIRLAAYGAPRTDVFTNR
jgi:hypothetical protein